MKRTLLAVALAVVTGLPLGWLLTMLATPLLWKLEPVLHMELAGHSGPSDWVFYFGWAIVMPVLFWLFFKLLTAQQRSDSPTAPR
jgi:hypothetical protein